MKNTCKTLLKSDTFSLQITLSGTPTKALSGYRSVSHFGRLNKFADNVVEFSATFNDKEVIPMSELLKGNFEVKHKINVDEKKDDAENFKNEFRKKALESIGGSMVFVERRQLVWDGGDLNDEDKK